jgi:hypothetical protein
VAVGGPQRPQHLADPALAHADQAGDVGERKPLSALDLPQPPELLNPLGIGQFPAAQRAKGVTDVVLADADLAGDVGRVERPATGDLSVAVELLDLLQRLARWTAVL